MNKYKVKITHLFSEVLEVEAENKEDAKQKTLELIQKDDFKGNPVYETTISPEHWKVITEEEFQELVKSFTQELEKEKESNIITP